MSDAPKVAVIGAGYWGKNLVRNIHALGQLAMICDSVHERLDTFAEQYPDVALTHSVDVVLANPAVKAVMIATPSETHVPLVRKALEMDKDVFVEKPLALSVQEGEAVIKLAAERGRILMVGHILRYHPAVIKLLQMVHDGELGRIRYVYSNRLNMGKIRQEENILWSFAPHDISVILALLNEQPAEIDCQGGAWLNQGNVDVTMSQFVFPSGVRAHIFVSWLHPFKEQKLVVVGSEKMAVLDDTIDDKLVLYPHKVAWKNHAPTAIKAEGTPVALTMHEPLRAECAHFLDCIETRATPLTDGHEGLRVLRVLDACQRALEGKPAVTQAPTEDWYAHPSAVVHDSATVGKGSKIWHFCHVMKDAVLGDSCNLGQNCHVAPGVRIGNNVKIQNNVSLYTGTEIEDDVFLGPSCVLTNVTNPRGQVNRRGLYESTLIRRGATIGANATVVCGVTIGRYAFIGAGAVVTRDVPDYALIIGNPGRQSGWMSRHGHRLIQADADGVFTCPESGYRYREDSPGKLRCLDLDEDAPLPEALSVGVKTYDDFKNPSEDAP